MISFDFLLGQAWSIFCFVFGIFLFLLYDFLRSKFTPKD